MSTKMHIFPLPYSICHVENSVENVKNLLSQSKRGHTGFERKMNISTRCGYQRFMQNFLHDTSFVPPAAHISSRSGIVSSVRVSDAPGFSEVPM
ncbi:MAG: hypothetical protein LUD54_06390 [Oscillospiraceae bacterium]|nr:hypothetical protein [Oscillospiraceae bacterium]